MSKAYKCDRCGRFSVHEPKARMVDYEGGFGTKPAIARRGEHWLCVSCYEDFEDFLENTES